MNSVQATTDEARKREKITDLGPGAHQCWYPVALSDSVPAGKAIGVGLADGRIVVYRGEDGVVRAMTAYCKHMGADLSVGGDVVGNSIRCPYHHWAFGDGGKCLDVPSGGPIPKRSNLASLPVAEQYGLVWVFFGEEPLYEIQSFDEFDEENYVYHSCAVKLDDKLLVEPWIFTTNVFDIVHNRVVHGLAIEDPEVEQIDPFRWRMVWNATHTGEKATGELQTEINVFGTNSIRTKGLMDGRLKWYIAAMVPSVREGTKFFLTIITNRDETAGEFLKYAEAVHTRFLNEDLPILNNMRYGDLHLVSADRAMARFIRAARDYPRTTLDALETAANIKAA